MNVYDTTIAGFQGTVIDEEGRLVILLKSTKEKFEIISVVDKSPDDMPYLVFNMKKC